MAKFEIKDGVAIIPEGTTEIEVSAYSDEMSWVEAIRKVLVEAGVPMHYKDITRTIKEKKYRLNFGDTPEMTVSNRLTTNPDLFKRVEKGVYGLVDTSITKVDLNVSLRDLVLACIETIGRKCFEAKELYAFAPIFKACMPQCQNLESTLKQQLDELVKEGLLDALPYDCYSMK
jgi:hypothetical protein